MAGPPAKSFEFEEEVEGAKPCYFPDEEGSEGEVGEREAYEQGRRTADAAKRLLRALGEEEDEEGAEEEAGEVTEEQVEDLLKELGVEEQQRRAVMDGTGQMGAAASGGEGSSSINASAASTSSGSSRKERSDGSCPGHGAGQGSPGASNLDDGSRGVRSSRGEGSGGEVSSSAWRGVSPWPHGWSPRKKNMNEDENSSSWRNRSRHFLVVSNAGKPIYSHHGDELRLAALGGIVQAVVSFVESRGDSIRTMTAGEHQIVFSVKGPLILVAISRHHLPPSCLLHQLSLLRNMLLLLLTTAVERSFLRSPKFDMRSLLGGTDAIFAALTHSFAWLPSSFLSAAHPLHMPLSRRNQISSALAAAASEAPAKFAVLFSGFRVISVMQPKKSPLHPDDLFLLLVFLNASDSFRAAPESFSPVCLPLHDAASYLYAYVHFFPPNVMRLPENLPPAGVVLLSPDSQSFESLKAARVAFEKNLRNICGQDGWQIPGQQNILMAEIWALVREQNRRESEFRQKLAPPGGSAVQPGPGRGREILPLGRLSKEKEVGAEKSDAASISASEAAPGRLLDFIMDGEGKVRDEKIFGAFGKQGLDIERGEPGPTDAPQAGPGGMIFFIFISTTAQQFVCSDFPPVARDKKVQKRVLVSLARLHSLMHGRDGGPPNGFKTFFKRTEHFAVIGWRMASFEMYAAFDSMVHKDEAINVCNVVTRHVGAREGDVFFARNFFQPH